MFPNRDGVQPPPDGPDRSGRRGPADPDGDAYGLNVGAGADIDDDADEPDESLPAGGDRQADGWDDPVIREWLIGLSEQEHAERLAEQDGFDLARLDTLVAGERLAGVVCRADPAGLNGTQLVEYFAAVRRLVAHFEALGLAAVNELGYCPPGAADDPPSRESGRHERGVGAVEAHVGWGRRRARSHDDLAYKTREVFPATWAALAEGLIEVDGAHAIVDGVAVLDDHLQHQIESKTLRWLRRLLADGRRVPAYQIRLRVERDVVAADEEGAERRHRERVKTRGLEYRPSVDSVADLLLHDLPADQATEIYNYIDAIAQTQARRGRPHPGPTPRRYRRESARRACDADGVRW